VSQPVLLSIEATDWSPVLSVDRRSYVSTTHQGRHVHHRSAREMRDKPHFAVVMGRLWDYSWEPRAAQGGSQQTCL